MSFVERELRVTFIYGTGPDGNGAPEIAEVGGLRMAARAVLAGGASMGELQLRIYGMRLDMMNRLSTLGVPVTLTRRNTVIVEAGDRGSQLFKMFEGTIYAAWADLNAAPDTAFEVQAHTGLINQMAPAPPSSFKGAADVATIMGTFARQMGYVFENSGVSGVTLIDPAFNGTLRQQAAECVQHADINWVIDGSILAIWPKNAARNGPVAQVGPGFGMVGYPRYTANGLIVKALYDPRFRFGGIVQVDSALPVTKGQATNPVASLKLPVDGKWSVVTMTHDLACQFPGGPWFTDMMLVPPGYTVLPTAR